VTLLALLIASWLILQVLTLGIIVADGALPNREGPNGHPRLRAAVALSALPNPLALPFYFGRSRRSWFGALAGVALFLLCLIAVLVAARGVEQASHRWPLEGGSPW
jgi:hypothetical protein